MQVPKVDFNGETTTTQMVDFIGLTNTITAKDRPGNLYLFTQICKLEVTEEELLQIREIQKEAEEKIKAVLNK